MAFFKKLLSGVLGNKTDKDIQTLFPYVELVNNEFDKLSSLSNDELRYKTTEFREILAKELKPIDDKINELNGSIAANPEMDPEEKEEIYKEVDELSKEKDKELEAVLLKLLPESFAVVKEVATRFTNNEEIVATASDLDREFAVNAEHIQINGDQVSYAKTWMAAGVPTEWNMIHYDVQIVGGVVLHQGKIAEMATGEGKTLVSTFPAYLNGLTGLGVHLVTVNDYLARRDAEWMAPILNFLGLTVDCIDKYKPHSEERKKAYRADVTYGTNNEFGFDYLRDNMVRNPNELVQGKHHFAMIDEVDSVLVDDARTPLIISGPVERGDQHEFHTLKPRIEKIFSVQKKLLGTYLVSAKKKIAAGDTGYNEGEGGLDLYRAFRGLPKHKPLIKFLSEPGIKKILLQTENHYLQEQQKNMPEADKELYFTIDEKNNQVDLTEKGIELITGAGEDPDFFILTDLGALLADLDKMELSVEEKIEKRDLVIQEFSIKSERIHSISQLLKAYTLFEIDVEYILEGGKVKIVDEQTGRVMDGRRYSDGLHQAIEAKENVKVEAATQTYATVTLQNFFRMYHKLSGMTGTAETEAGEFWDIYGLDVVVIPTNRPITRDDREDMVYRTVREKFNAVIEDIEVIVEQKRPILVGTTSVEISELLSRMLKLKGIPHNVLNAKQHAREADVVAEAGQPGTVTIATNMAGRGTDIKLGEGVKEAGGLAIIGTERHDSRRVDRQLRGRAGRQGDPGSSQFYVSLEDNLLRLFGSDRVAGIMDKMGYKEGEVIQHSMITKSIERAQQKVEENNFGIRKRLLEYDDVMNSQREVIYKRRKHALFGERLSVDLTNAFYDLCEEIVMQHKGDMNHEEFEMDVIRNFAISTSIDELALQNESEQELITKLFQESMESYNRKAKHIMESTRKVIQSVYESRGETVENIVVPFTDGQKAVRVVANLSNAYDTNGRSLVRDLEKSIALAFIDDSWKDHLRQMDDLKQSVQSAVYEQKDPLLIYKFEAFELFKQMVSTVNQEVASFLFKAKIPVNNPDEVKEARTPAKTDLSKMKMGRSDAGESATRRGLNTNGEPKKVQPIRVAKKVGRNEPCPCGSGKKYKQCHGKLENA